MKESEIKKCIESFLNEMKTSTEFSQKIKDIANLITYVEDVKDLMECINTTILGVSDYQPTPEDLYGLVEVFEKMEKNEDFKNECAKIMNVDSIFIPKIVFFANDKLETEVFTLREAISKSIQEEKFNKGLKKLFYELSASFCFAESASISGDFEIEDMPDVVIRGKMILLNLKNENVSDENKEYEIECLKDMFSEMGYSYSFACECAETMEIDIEDMPDFVSYVKGKLGK